MNNIKTKSNIRFFLLPLLLLCSWPLLAANNTVNGFRVWDSPEGSRLIIDLKSKPEFEVFSLDNPHRIVIDLKQTLSREKSPSVKRNHPIIKSVRSAPRKNRAHRIVIDTKGEAKFRTYDLLPNREYGHRLVVDLNSDKPAEATLQASTENVTGKTDINTDNIEKEKRDNNKQHSNKLRDIIVAIDAGHGGEDPGATGRKGTKEKHVALRIAKKLKKAIDEQNGFRGVLVRKGDYYLTLRRRMEIARENSADMFISVHADAYKNPRVKGSSVFILSERGASDEAAKWLADQENSADLVGGVSLDDKDKTLAMVLLDLSQTATIDASGRVASSVLNEIQKIGPVHNDSVQHARFVVLKSPDVPSILVETAFISNPREEKRLNDSRYQAKLANAILRGVKRYFTNNPPPNTHLASLDNVKTLLVEPGDTLGEIARSLKVSVASLKSLNQMRSENIRAGQILNIPF